MIGALLRGGLSPLGQALRKPGTPLGAGFAKTLNQFLYCNDNADLSIPIHTSFTIGCWAYLTSKTASTEHNFVAKDTVAAGGREYRLALASNDRLSMTVCTGSAYRNNVDASTFGSPPTGQWLCVVAYYDDTAQRLGIQVNGGTTDTVVETNGATDGTAPFRLGARADGPQSPLDGRLDEVALWKRALTSGERLLYYNSGLGLTKDLAVAFGLGSNLIAWWSLDEAAGAMRGDAVGSNHLTDNYAGSGGVLQVAGLVVP